MFGPPQAWTTFSDVTGVLQDLLSTTNSKDVIDLPKRNKCILGVTSLWMILPIAHGMLQWLQGDIGVRQKVSLFIIALCCSCCSSTIFWLDARTGSLFHKLDKFFYFICMVFVTALPGKSGRVLSPGVCIFLPSSMIPGIGDSVVGIRGQGDRSRRGAGSDAPAATRKLREGMRRQR